MGNKILAGTLSIVLVGSGFAVWQLIAQSSVQQEQLSSFESYVDQLQAELESFAEQKVAYETELNAMRREQLNNQSLIDSLENELELAEAQIDPDVIQLEQQIRERVIVEIQQADDQSLSRRNLLKQLTAMNPDDLGQLMAIQGLYGGFLRELDVDEQRLNVIVDGLSNIVEEQNQLRMDAIEQLRNNPDQDNALALREQMIALSSPEAQLEALSYLLTEEELAAYQQFQQQQRQNGVVQAQTFSIRGARPLAEGRAGFAGGNSDVIVQDGQGQTQAIQIIRTEPAPQ